MNRKNKKGFSIIKTILYTACIFIIISTWALLTKEGVIPNFLHIEILHHYDPNNPDSSLGGKPVIYLYPQQKQNIKVKLDFDGKIIADYPQYNKTLDGWDVIAYPDGHLVNTTDGQKYSYLFWEGIFRKSMNWDLSKGFIVEGNKTRDFLQDTLSRMGLTPKEYNEFIVWWYPKMKDNKYNLIHFANKKYTDAAKLTITPEPDSMLRVFMVFKPLEESIDIEPQIIKPFKRKGFTVVEWGGTELN